MGAHQSALQHTIPAPFSNNEEEETRGSERHPGSEAENGTGRHRAGAENGGRSAQKQEAGEEAETGGWKPR